MGPVLIVKLCLSGLLSALNAAENFIPDGKLKEVFQQIEKYGHIALDILGKASLADDESAEQSRARLAKCPAVVGEK